MLFIHSFRIDFVVCQSSSSSTSRERAVAATGRAAADDAATRAGTKSVMIRSQWYDRRRAPMTGVGASTSGAGAARAGSIGAYRCL